MLKKYIVFIAALFLLVLSACDSSKSALKIGSKNFSENMILAEMMAKLAEQEGIKVERRIPYGDTASILEATKQGAIDLYPEYNGTGLVYLGQAPVSDGDSATTKVQVLFKPLGLDWRGRFGFSNDYVLVMTKDRAKELGIKNISDLARSKAFTVAAEDEFVARPADGLNALLRRYGLTNNSSTLKVPNGSEGKEKMVSALFDGKTDVAELFATDGQISEFDLQVLQDDLKFFPVYEPAPLVRNQALAANPKLQAALDKLKGLITANEMQVMNKDVELNAQRPSVVAEQFLVDKGLLPKSEIKTVKNDKVILATGSETASLETAKALKAIRAGFKGNDIEVLNSTDPLQSLKDGSARMALVGAESFYTTEINADSAVAGSPHARNVAQAIGVVGYKTAHLIVPSGKSGQSFATMHTIGTLREGTGSPEVLRFVQGAAGAGSMKIDATSANLAEAVKKLTAGEFDALFVMARQGSPDIKTALHGGNLSLIGIPEWAEKGNTATYNFLRPTTIPANTYPNQPDALASIGSQQVLAAALPKNTSVVAKGPITALYAVSDESIKSINKVLASAEGIDPAIPSHPALLPSLKLENKSLPFDFSVSFLTFLMLSFSVWMLYLLFLPSPTILTLED